MTKSPNFNTMNSDEFLAFISSSSTRQIQDCASTISNEQCATLIKHLQDEEDKADTSKLAAIIAGIHDRKRLEKIGVHLSANLFLDVVSNIEVIEQEDERKLSPLIVGMTHETFVAVLDTVSDKELTTLRQEACAEPIQHQLTVFSHQMTKRLEEFITGLLSLETEIDNLAPAALTRHTIESINNAIAMAGEEAAMYIHRINNALAISWNTTREDLIEALSYQKECWSKFNTLVVGIPETETDPPTGLYARFYERLSSIFGNKDDPTDIEALLDSDPSIEALVKFSVWYLQDYWNLGLLPHIKDIKDLDLNSSAHSSKQRAEYRAELFKQAQENLSRIGLKTVSDLKENQIFSQAILKAFIRKNLVAKK